MNVRPTHAELLQERRRRIFVGRTHEREVFARNFRIPTPEATIFWVHGRSGTGKSALAASFLQIAGAKGGFTALANEAEATPVRETSILNVMGRIAAQLAEAGVPLESFEALHSVFQEEKAAIEADPAAPRGTFDRLSFPGWPSGEPGGEARQIDRNGAWRCYLSAKLRDAGLVQLLSDPVSALTPLFVEGLNAIAECQTVVLCFDTWEWTGAHVGPWLHHLLEDRGLSSGVWLVIAGRHAPGDEWLRYLPVVEVFELYEFTAGEGRRFLRLQGIAEEGAIQQILDLSECLPLLVSTLSSAWRASSEAGRDRTSGGANAGDDLVPSYLRWIEGESLSGEIQEGSSIGDLVVRCASARRLDRGVVGALLGAGDDEKLFEWLVNQPFVQGRPGYWEYHPVFRQLLLDYARRRSLRDARAWHARLEAHYGDLADTGGDQPRYHDAAWRENWVEALYHALMSQRRAAVRDGLEAFLLALGNSFDLAGAVAQAWVQAGDDAGSVSELRDWGRTLVTAWLAIDQGAWDTLLDFRETMISRHGLSSRALGHVYLASGLAYCAQQDHARCIDEYGRAVELLPDSATAYYSRGCAFAGAGEVERAVDDLTRALERNPGHVPALGRRSACYLEAEDYVRAIGDYDRLLALDPTDAETWYNRGMAHAAQGAFGKAIDDFSRTVELAPDAVGAYYNRGIAHDRVEAYDRAVQDYSRAVELEPEFAQAYNNRGSARVALGKDQEAVEDYTRAIEIDATYLRAFFNRGLARARLGDHRSALADFDMALKLDPKHAAAYKARGLAHARLSHDELAIRDLDRAVEMGLGDVSVYRARGVAHARLGSGDGAVKDYRRALELEPGSAGLLNGLGMVRAAQGDYAGAIEDFGRAIEQDPNDAEAYRNRGLARVELEDLKGGIEDLNRALEIDPQYGDVYYRRGLVYELRGNAERAMADFDRAIEQDPALAAAYHRRGLLHALQREYARAVQDYDRAIELKPGLATPYYHRGIAYDALGDYEFALQDYNRAIELNPENASAYYNRGTVRARLDQYREAIEDFDRVIALSPGNSRAYNNRGLAYGALHEYIRAIESYDQAVELDPNSAAAFNNRGLAYANLQDFLRAIEDYDRALERDPDYALAHYNKACAHACLDNPKAASRELAAAIEFDAKYREMARTDSDFDGIRHLERFQSLVQE